MMEEKELTGYPSIDKPWLKYYSEEAIRADVPKGTIFQNIYDHNRAYPQDVALLYFGKKITYRQLFREIEKAEKAFLACGVRRGDNVALCVPATPEAIYAILALNKIGANANMLNPTFTQQQLTDRINDTEAALLLVVGELYAQLEDVIPQTKIKTVISYPAVNSLGPLVKFMKKARDIPHTIPWNQFIAMGRNTSPFAPAPYEKDVPAIMVYSSGTTGASKGIQLTNDGINATITQYEYAGFVMSRQDRYFAQVPIWFSTGIAATMLVPLCLGVTVILEPLYDFELFYQHISKYKPNFMVTAVGLVDYLRNKKEIDPAYKEFKYLAIGGEYVVPHAEVEFNNWLKENGCSSALQKGYGMCECGGTVTATHPQSNKIGSVGIPLANVTVSAFDLVTGKELKYGQRGEIRVLSPCRMKEYYKRPDATSDYFRTDENGNVWACTGDMGYVSEDGNIYVDGRINDSYIDEQGNTIYLFDIERSILEVEAVRQCKVVVSEIDGKQTHVAHVVFSLGKGTAENIMEQVKSVCAKKLPANHQPQLLKLYSDALPVAPSGKLNTAKMKADTQDLISIQ